MMSRPIRSVFPFRPARRGSVYVIVVAGLSLLGLVTLTLSYTAQVEEQASKNWSEGIQARIGAVTGVPVFVSKMGASMSERSLSSGSAQGIAAADPRAPRLLSSSSLSSSSSSSPDSFNLSPPASSVSLASTVSRLGIGSSKSERVPGSDRETAMDLLSPSDARGVDLSSFLKSDVAYHRVEDESAKFNLNAILDVVVDLSDEQIDFLEASADAELPNPLAAPSIDQFGAFIDEILAAEGIAHAPSGESLARALVKFRYGSDGKPGVSGTDDNLNGVDVGYEEQLAAFENGDHRMILKDPLVVPLNADGRDNDRDGQIDEPDESLETDGLDNDHDGQIDEVGEGVDEPSEFRADIRLKPVGDDRPFARLESLLQVPGFTTEIIDALRPYVTVFSASRSGSSESSGSGSETGFISLDPNTATAEEIFSMLRARYSSQPEELIGQYVANIIDRRDIDNVPSELTLGSLGEPYVGIEVTPYINEVCPDVATFDEDGDDGQFLELANPYTQDFDLTGWRIETGMSTVYLRGILKGGGYLVVTDDYDDSNDLEPEEEPGLGSLYDVFGVVPTGLDRLIQEQETFSLNDQQGVVKLYDNNDTLVDSFSYTDAQFNGANTSLQRIDPRVRYYVEEMATPLDHNAGYSPPDPEDEAGLALFEAVHNHPFYTSLELMLVSTSFAYAGTEETGSNQWRFPSIRPGTTQNLDIRVVDLFQPGSPAPMRLSSADAEVFSAEMDQILSILERPPAFFGRINLNTAAPVVLAGLPGMDKEFAEKIAELRGKPLSLGDDFPEIEIRSRIEEENTQEEEVASEVPSDETGEGEGRIYGEVTVLDEYGFAALGFGTHRVLSQLVEAKTEAAPRPDSWYTALSPQSNPRWNSLSEFVRDRELWGDASFIERIERIYRFSSMMTCQSLSYRVKTANIPVVADDPSSTRRPSVMFTERLIAADRNAMETVVFLYGHRVADGRR